MHPQRERSRAALKNKVVAGVLAILLGGLGIHKFYLGKLGQGILYLIFAWTAIPSIIGLIEGILYLVQSDEEFNRKYNYYMEE
jgi:TM2 domain-containing membrane protein YozV